MGPDLRFLVSCFWFLVPVNMNPSRGFQYRVAPTAFAGLLCYCQWRWTTEIDGKWGTALDLPPLFPAIASQFASCIFVFFLTWASVYPLATGTGAKHLPVSLLRATGLSIVFSFFIFEYFYLISRMPALSCVSLSLALRPWMEILPLTGITFVLLWPCLFLVLQGRDGWKRIVHLIYPPVHRC